MITDKLNIADPENIDFGLMLGVTKDRQLELAKKLDEMVKLPKELSLVYVSSIIRYIEDFCETKEEFYYCFMNHMYYLLIKQRAIPKSLAADYIESIPVHDLK